MSYFFSMAFINVPDKTTAYDLCQNAVKLLSEKVPAQEHIKNMYPFFKTRCKFEHIEPTNFIKNMWIQDIFQLKFVYWSQHNLLALCGDKYPKAVTNLIGKAVEFQNSTDQDYSLDTWDPNVPIFQTIITDISMTDAKAFKSVMEYDDSDYIDEDYIHRSAVYKSIFNVLDLDKWLYGRDGQFERIRMSGLTSVEKISDVQRWMRSITIKFI